MWKTKQPLSIYSFSVPALSTLWVAANSFLTLPPHHTLSPRAWIQELSTYATSSLLRAAKLGAEIWEPWVVENAATHLWNYSTQLLAAGQYEQLLPAFQTVVELLLKTDSNRYYCRFDCYFSFYDTQFDQQGLKHPSYLGGLIHSSR